MRLSISLSHPQRNAQANSRETKMKHKNYDTRFEEKWSRSIAQHGHTPLPNLLIEHQSDLEITPSELTVILGLLKHRWTREEPFPSVNRLGTYSGLAHQTIRRNLRSLEAKSLIKRILRKGETSKYDIKPLIQKLESYAQPKTNPAQKRADPYSKTRGSPYPKLNNKEDPYKNTKRKYSNGKAEKIGEIMQQSQ